MRHGAPGVVGGGGLGVPDVARVTGELSRLQGADDRVAVDDLGAGGVDDVGARPHGRQQLLVEEVLRLGVERGVDGDHVDVAGEFLGTRVEGQAQLLLDLARQLALVGVVEADAEGLEAAQHGLADAAGGDDADVHALQVVGVRDAVGDVPAALGRDLVGGQVVADQGQDLHHGVLGDADAVAVRDLGDGDAAGDGGVQVDVVGADAGGQRQLQLRGAGDALGGEVGGPERLGYHHVGVGQFTVQLRVGALLVGGDDQGVAPGLQEFPQAQLPGDAAHQFAGGEVEALGGRQGLAAGVAVERGEGGARVLGREAGDRVRVENADDLRHDFLLGNRHRKCGFA